MDPVTLATLVGSSIYSLIDVVKLLKGVAETVKDAREDLGELLRRSERTRNILELLRITSRELDKTRFRDMNLAMDLTKFEQTMKQLLNFARDVVGKKAKVGLAVRLNWVTKKSEVKVLSDRMAEHEREILDVLMIVNTASTLRTQSEVERMAQRAVDRSELQRPFDRLTITVDSVQTKSEETDDFTSARTWLGYNTIEDLPEDYVILRKELSDAAYWGEWNKLLNILKEGRERYNESWVNAVRMKTREQANNMSFWAPLHQAAYWRAPVDVVRKLIDLGASRTLRSRWSDYTYLDMTPLELAHEFEASELYDILSPVIRHPVPTETLALLETQFHSLIRADLGAHVENHRLYLPVLEVLTELRDEPMWFPIKSTLSAAGYAYQLDGRDLLVRSFNVHGTNEQRTYRITEEECFEIDEALMFGA
ncbi:hypothetical protein PMZ80_005903 [Knufia obscura]|uniref:Fungal N-terminal domain-containing protein n=1 Tax=Knufia obscura TaxID=1635080 RepID=A0ABR0RMY1_9EURO|nr:hypothetical protein PMZ80_005903 [Knufia obscura]